MYMYISYAYISHASMCVQATCRCILCTCVTAGHTLAQTPSDKIYFHLHMFLRLQCTSIAMANTQSPLFQGALHQQVGLQR